MKINGTERESNAFPRDIFAQTFFFFRDFANVAATRRAAMRTISSAEMNFHVARRFLYPQRISSNFTAVEPRGDLERLVTSAAELSVPVFRGVSLNVFSDDPYAPLPFPPRSIREYRIQRVLQLPGTILLSPATFWRNVCVILCSPGLQKGG